MVTIRGVELRLHFSLVFLLMYVVFVSAIQFPLVVQQSGLLLEELRTGPWTAGVVFALGLFFSIALHEYGHVFVAQAQGTEVRGVTLMMLGGVSEMHGMSEKPYSEMKLALVGPMVSLVLGGILELMRRASSSAEISFFSYWLANANFALGIFNLVPAFPLDGGRALRSFLAVKKGNLKATEAAVGVSKVFSLILGIAGFFSFNILMVLIAIFLFSASQSELSLLLTRGMLKNLRVEQVMRGLQPISENLTLNEVAAQMLRSRVKALPVEFRAGSIGLITLDALRDVSRELWSKVQVGEVVEDSTEVLNAEDLISQVIAQLSMSPAQILPVQKFGKAIGVLRYSDLSDVIQFKSLEPPPPDERKAA